ncbi:unnamed protein product [marine sediment metagenome]|uniref:Uncharacterized protein n=1 Tax=marine sediment metagenome TaxID=412755 RepID=X1BB32_9ZZZZ
MGIRMMIIIIMVIVIALGITAVSLEYKANQKNYEEIGLKISNEERECLEFCDGEEYYFKHGRVGSIFSSGYAPTCQCKKSNR